MGNYRQTIDLDLSDFGDGCSVTIRDPRVVCRLSDFKSLRITNSEGEFDEDGYVEAMTGRAFDLAARLIVSWSGVDDVETGQPLTPPAGDVALVKRAPEFVILRIAEEVAKRMSPLFQRQSTTPTETES